jgi:hypothetical protein
VAAHNSAIGWPSRVGAELRASHEHPTVTVLDFSFSGACLAPPSRSAPVPVARSPTLCGHGFHARGCHTGVVAATANCVGLPRFESNCPGSTRDRMVPGVPGLGLWLRSKSKRGCPNRALPFCHLNTKGST